MGITAESATQLPKRGGTAEAQRARASANRDALIKAARILFTERGFSATGINDVGAHIALTRGAVYHHFENKEELFEAVSRAILDELIRETRASVEPLTDDVWGRAVGGWTTYLKLIASNREYQRILLIDGPAVLGWRRWRDMIAAASFSHLTVALERLMQLGVITEQAAMPLASLIQAALNDAALTIAHAREPGAASIEMTKAFIFLFEGLRQRPRPIQPRRRAKPK